MKRGKESRFELVLYGVLIGMVANFLFLIPTFIQSNVYFGILYTAFLVFSVSFTAWSLLREKGRRARKARLCFFGISLISFVFGLFDVAIFAFGFHGMKVSFDYPYLWMGDIPFISFLASIFTGGFFSVLERFLDLLEKKDF